MNGHSKLGTIKAAAWPVAAQGGGYHRMLIKVVVESDHPLGHARLHLSAEQGIFLHSRLTQIAAVYLHGDVADGSPPDLPDPSLRPDDLEVRLGRTGVEAWPLCRAGAGDRPVLDVVLVESVHPDGHGVVRLSPEQTLAVRDQLEQILLGYVHENVWGGEDARRQ
jgi:hypothetical protein